MFGRKYSNILTKLLFTAWGVAICTGFFALYWHAFAAASPTSSPQSWPSETKLEIATDRPNILIFAHPLCPCTQATLTNLNEIVSRTHCDSTIVFMVPSSETINALSPDEPWQTSEIVKAAKRINNATIVFDESAREARRFGAQTSGQTLLYNRSGQLCFNGGITPSRGHIGPSRGATELEELVSQWETSPHYVKQVTPPVYGCTLYTESTNP